MGLFDNKSKREIVELTKSNVSLEMKNIALLELLNETLVSGSNRYTDSTKLIKVLMQLTSNTKYGDLYKDLVECLNKARTDNLDGLEITEVESDILSAIELLIEEDDGISIINSAQSWENISEALDSGETTIDGSTTKISPFHYTIFSHTYGDIHILRATGTNRGVVISNKEFKPLCRMN